MDYVTGLHFHLPVSAMRSYSTIIDRVTFLMHQHTLMPRHYGVPSVSKIISYKIFGGSGGGGIESLTFFNDKIATYSEKLNFLQILELVRPPPFASAAYCATFELYVSPLYPSW